MNNENHFVNFNRGTENIIEISMVYASLHLLDETTAKIDSVVMKHMIINWANEFEHRFGDVDWNSSEDDYVLVIHDFAVSKILKYIGYEDKDILPLMETDWEWGF